MLVTGGAGHLATALRKHFPSAVYADKKALDVGDAESVRRFFQAYTFDVVLHAGAVTDYDAPTTDLIRVNVHGTHILSQYARTHGAYFVYCSTDYVYAGLSGHYNEISPPSPVNGYAWSKYCGEHHAERVPDHLIIRGSWYPETWNPEFAICDAFTSKIPVSVAAAWIAALVDQRAMGVVNVGGERTQLSDIAYRQNPNARAMLRHQLVELLPYEFPYDTSLDTRKLHRLLRGEAAHALPSM